MQGGAQSRGMTSGVEEAVSGLGARGGASRAGQLTSGALQPGARPEVGALPPLATTQFQQFVQETTGRVVDLHGYKLFDRPRFPSVADAPVPATYVVGPGDELDIKIWGGVEFTARVAVDREGQITVPRLGPVTVAGVKAADLDTHLRKQLSKVYANFEISATVGKIRSIQVFVVGQARSPGAHSVSSLSTLIGAVFEAGGPAATGSMRRIELQRAGTKVATLDLYKFIESGDMSADARLLPGDVIVVPPAGPRVAVLGAIDNPGIFELASEQEPVSAVLAYSRSATTLAAPQRVLLERIDNSRAKGPREVLELSLNETGLKRPLRDGDVLTLQRVGGDFANAVTLRGNVAKPLRYPFKPGMRVSDLIPDADALIVGDYFARKGVLVQYERGQGAVAGRGVSAEQAVADARSILPQINWEYASIERLNRAEVTTELIPFNLGQAVRNRLPEHNLLLQPGDVVTVYSVNELPVPRERLSQFVRLTGEVKVPGIYQITPGETLVDLVNRAGGFSSQAYVYGTVFQRESTRVQQQSNLEQAVRRYEAQVGAQANTLLQNATSAEAAQTQQLQLAAQRATLERLRTLRASGRVALDLNPARPQLPRVALEDGDVINVPPTPSFVSVFGAVTSDTSFIHRAGATVADYIKRAGATRDADLQAAMLIRSDGTVLAASAQSCLLCLGNSGFMATPVYPGDSVFVPEVLDRRTPFTQFMQGAKDVSQLFFQFGLGAAAIRTLRN